jgi:hypothetical protein
MMEDCNFTVFAPHHVCFALYSAVASAVIKHLSTIGRVLPGDE